MWKIKEKIYNADQFVFKKYKTINKSFFGKVVLKACGEIVLACMIAVAVYGGSMMYDNLSNISEENKKLNEIYISISDEYIYKQFGTPYISFTDDNDLTNRFFLLKDAVLRTVSSDQKIVAYFITISEENRKIPVDSFESEKRVLGKTTYSELEFANPEKEVNISTNGRYCYYFEMQGTGRYGMFNNYIYGNAPYGIKNNETIFLMQSIEFNNATEKEISELKKKAKPDTFGIIADGYSEKISILPMCDEWENMYYLLEYKR